MLGFFYCKKKISISTYLKNNKNTITPVNSVKQIVPLILWNVFDLDSTPRAIVQNIPAISPPI